MNENKCFDACLSNGIPDLDQVRPKFAIGTKFLTRHKHPRLCTVNDYRYTYNSKGKLVNFCYVTTHEFMGQVVTDYDVVETTIARGAR